MDGPEECQNNIGKNDLTLPLLAGYSEKMRPVALFLLLSVVAIPPQGCYAFDCSKLLKGTLDFFFKAPDEFAMLDPVTVDRVTHFAPGEAVSVHLKNEAEPPAAYLLNNGIQELTLVTPDGKRISFKASKIVSIEPASLDGAFPFPDELSFLNRIHAVQVQYAKWNPPAIWSELHDSLAAEIAQLRKMTKNEREGYLRRVGDRIVEEAKQKHGTGNIGFHYNLNGGYVQDFLEGGGLLISKGDIQLVYGSGDANEKVFFFQSARDSLFDILNQPNPKLIGAGRMGNVLTTFRLDGDWVKRAKAEGGITGESTVSFDFSESWIRRQPSAKILNQPRVGIPASEYLAPPTVVFSHLRKRVGMGALTRNEETLATMRYLEYLWTRL